MRKKLLSTLLALCMVMALLPTAALAAETALPAAEDGVITLTEDVTLSSYAIIRGADNVTTLDLGGKTLSFAGTGNFPATLYVNGGTLTIKNGTIKNEGDFALSVYNSANVTLDDVDIVGITFGVAVGKEANNDASVLNVTNGSTISATGESESAIGDGIRAYSGSVVIENGCSVTASSTGIGVELYADVTVEIKEGATVSGRTGVRVIGGTLKSAGTITGTNDSGIYVTNGDAASGSKLIGKKSVTVTNGSVSGTGGAVTVAQSAVNDATNTTDIDLKDGTFTGSIVVEESQSEGDETGSNVDLSITGGTFSDKGSAEKYLADGLEINEQGEVVTAEVDDLSVTETEGETETKITISSTSADCYYIIQSRESESDTTAAKVQLTGTGSAIDVIAFNDTYVEIWECYASSNQVKAKTVVDLTVA